MFEAILVLLDDPNASCFPSALGSLRCSCEAGVARDVAGSQALATRPQGP